MTPRLRRAAAALAIAASPAAASPILAGPPDRAAPREERRAPSAPAGIAKPGEAPVMSAARIEQTAPGEFELTGEVDFRYGIARLLADSVRYSESSRKATAEGNVVLQLGGSQVSGDRIEVDLDSEHAVIENARAYIEPDVIVDAERLERIAEDTFRITRGTITTCTQPTPYWSFHVGTAVVRLGAYAHMRNASFRVGRVPAFWSPYLIWPVKENRAAGLLIPHFGFTRKRGAFLSNSLYVPFGRSVDATAQFDFFNGAVSGATEQLPQAGQGLEVRYVPTPTGSGTLTGYFLSERFRPAPGADVVERDRYHVSLAHTQRLAGGFKLLADFNTVSDLDYFLDFEREIRYSTSPTVLSQVDLSRQEGHYAANVRFNRQLQFLGVDTDRSGDLRTLDLTLYRLPEVELRGRGLRIGRTPFYLTFEGSLDGFARRTRGLTALDAFESERTTYSRLDFFPTVSGNFTPIPWLDVSPVIAFRETYYTASDRDPGADLDPKGPSVHREQYRVGLGVVGPRLFRLYGKDSPETTRYKHTIEPRIAYDFVPEATGGERIIPFDEIDAAASSSNLITYSLTSRLFAKRPAASAAAKGPAPALTGTFASLVFGEEAPTRHEETVPPAEGAEGAAPGGAAAPAGAVPPAEEAPAEASSREPAAGAAGPEEGPRTTGGETYVPPADSTGPGRRTPIGREGAGRGRGREPSVGSVEVATFDLTQRYSLDDLRPLSRARTSALESAFSPVEATVRFNPTYAASVDLRATYDILFHDLASLSLSGNLRARDAGYLRLSWFLNRDLEGTPASSDPSCSIDPTRPAGRAGIDPGRCFQDSSQIRLLGGTAILGRKITADVEGSYDIENSFLRDQRYRLGYNTQCCGVLVEIAKRSFQTAVIGATSETEYRFVLNLRGVGTFLDLNGRPQ